MKECLMPIILVIPYNTTVGAHNLWGILSSDAAQNVQHDAVFVFPTWTTIYLTISDDATSVVQSCSKTFHKLLWHHFTLHKVAECGCRAFLVDAVKDTSTREICHANSIYNKITTNALMEYLQFFVEVSTLLTLSTSPPN